VDSLKEFFFFVRAPLLSSLSLCETIYNSLIVSATAFSHDVQRVIPFPRQFSRIPRFQKQQLQIAGGFNQEVTDIIIDKARQRGRAVAILGSPVQGTIRSIYLISSVRPAILGKGAFDSSRAVTIYTGRALASSFSAPGGPSTGSRRGCFHGCRPLRHTLILLLTDDGAHQVWSQL